MSSSPARTLRILSGVAIRTELLELIRRFDPTSKHRIEVAFDLNPAIASRMLAGELFDVGLTNPWHVPELIAENVVLADTHMAFGRVPLAVGAGTPSTAIQRTSEQLRDLLLGAKSIGYTGEGTSGASFRKACEGLGLGVILATKAKAFGAGESVRAAASGQVELAIAPLTSVMAATGIWPVATFPSELDVSIDMSAFVGTKTKTLDVARQFVAYLAAPSNDSYLSAQGIERYEMDERFTQAGSHLERARP